MSRELHLRAKDIFLAAMRLPIEERRAFLEERCRSDNELRLEVDSLLGYADDSTDGGEPAAILRSRFMPDDRQIDQYRLVRRLGAGGMGEVHEARQETPVRRRVALKLIRKGMDTDQVIARFDSERQALALMSHSNITRVFDAGTTKSGRPYFVMELVDGVAITDYCKTNDVGQRDRLRLFLQVCDGVQHAHQQGIVHRDLKPSNILVTEEDGAALPKIIDFGIAKAVGRPLTTQSVQTQLGQWIGTPVYMSPEQARGSGRDVDTRTDIYALGVLLYELLTGVPPFEWGELANGDENLIRDQILHVDPVRPSSRVARGQTDRTTRAEAQKLRSLSRQLRGDLDWIVMKALEKDRARRYASPSELAADIRRHLDDQPVEASPPSARYRLGKLVRRHRLAVVASMSVLVALVIGMIGTSVGFVRARKAEQVAEREAAGSRQVAEFLVGIFDVLDPGSPRAEASTSAEVLGRGRVAIDRELADQPVVRARLKTTMGRIYANLGFLDNARPMLQEALATRTRLLGSNHVDVALTLEQLGWLERREGRFDAAAAAFERALTIHLDGAGPADPAVARARDSLGYIRWIQGRFEEAAGLYELALVARRQHFGAAHQEVAETLAHQGILLIDRADYEAAHQRLAEALDIRRKVHGDEHSIVAWSLHDLGWLHYRIGSLATAQRYFELARNRFEELFGSDHSNVAWPVNKLGLVAMASGDLADAERYLEEALDIRRRALGGDHLETAWSLQAHGELAALRDQPEQALDYLQASLDAWQSATGAEHIGVAFPLTSLASVLLEMGDVEAALLHLRRALEIREKVLSSDHPMLIDTLRRYAAALESGGRFREAEVVLQRIGPIEAAAELPEFPFLGM